jgi:signal recognition particle subunit SRP19
MVSKNEDKYVIWPIYFDKSLSRNKGRKVNKKLSVDKPNLENIFKAIKSLGLQPIIERDCAHPSRQWKREGRILIEKKGSKSKLLLQISNRL